MTARAPFRLHIATEPDRLYFGHMTVYPDGHKERLHGHNFRIFVDVDVADASMAKMVDLNLIRAPLETICAAWKERFLLASENPRFELIRDDGVELEYRLCGDRYVCPREDVVFLPIENCSVEGIAAYLCATLRDHLRALSDPGVVLGLELRVEELPGIGASCYLRL